MKKITNLVLNYPKVFIIIAFALTAFFTFQCKKLRWETDARAYLPKNHPIIKYDNLVDKTFGVKDSIIIAIENQKEGILNAVTLLRIARITKKLDNLPGVYAHNELDIASLATAQIFGGKGRDLVTKKIMDPIPKTDKEIREMKRIIYNNSELFVGNLISKDGKAAMIRVKLKEGAAARWMTYFQIKQIVELEQGIKPSGWWKGGFGNWEDNNKKEKKDNKSGEKKWTDAQVKWWTENVKTLNDKNTKIINSKIIQNGDKLYMAGRPVIEVTSGMFAMGDMKTMIPIVIIMITIILFLLFRTAYGVFLPLFVMAGGVIWTMGTMAFLDVPLYTISTMMPVILAAVGIGDSIHLLSNYHDQLKENTKENKRIIITGIMQEVSLPLLITSITTAIGFLSFFFAEMPPFKVFGVFTAIGVFYCWFISITFIPSMLILGKTKKEQPKPIVEDKNEEDEKKEDWSTKTLTTFGNFVNANKKGLAIASILTVALFSFGLNKLYVDSSWMDDFRKDSEVSISNKFLNKNFSGTIYLNVVLETEEEDLLLSPKILKKVEGLQEHLTKNRLVGGTLSVVDYVKSLNKALHNENQDYYKIPNTKKEIAQYLYLFSLSDHPEALDEVIDYNYMKSVVIFFVKTDHSKSLKSILDRAKKFIDQEFAGTGVTVNLAGSANNSYIWSKLLINSQTIAIIFSKVGIFLVSALIFRSFTAGLFIVIPITIATIITFGISGFLGIPLDVSTALAAGIAIGVGIDYAVHYIFRYSTEYNKSKNHNKATVLTIKTTGKAILFNAFVVTLGFSVLLFSQFPPHVKLGVFVSSYMIISCIVTMLTLGLIFSLKPKFAENKIFQTK